MFCVGMGNLWKPPSKTVSHDSLWKWDLEPGRRELKLCSIPRQEFGTDF